MARRFRCIVAFHAADHVMRAILSGTGIRHVGRSTNGRLRHTSAVNHRRSIAERSRAQALGTLRRRRVAAPALPRLGLKIADSPVGADAQRLVGELEQRGIRFKPHFWFSTEWFSPDGVPGIAVPFFLGHPRLVRLERRMMAKPRAEIDAGDCASCGTSSVTPSTRRSGCAAAAIGDKSSHRVGALLAGLHGAAAQQESRAPSRALVAQSHPTEDFADFRVWLGPKARWRAEYAAWPALAKLEFVDTLMTELAGRAPGNAIARGSSRSRTTIERWANTIGVALPERKRSAALRLVAHARVSGRRGLADHLAERLLIDLKPLLIRALLHSFPSSSLRGVPGAARRAPARA